MLTESQVDRVWEKKYGAEVRALYFADLAAKYTRTKQIITGLSFFLSSAAAGTVVGHLPSWVPVLLASTSAAATAYSIAIGLDRKAATMSKLYGSWSKISSDFERLWNHWYEEDAEAELDGILIQAREASQLGSTEAPNDEDRVGKWQSRINDLYKSSAA